MQIVTENGEIFETIDNKSFKSKTVDFLVLKTKNDKNFLIRTLDLGETPRHFIGKLCFLDKEAFVIVDMDKDYEYLIKKAENLKNTIDTAFTEKEAIKITFN
jgi:hypothetical protein